MAVSGFSVASPPSERRSPDERVVNKWYFWVTLAAIVAKNPRVEIPKERVLEVVRRETTVSKPVWESDRLITRVEGDDEGVFVDEFVKDRATKEPFEEVLRELPKMFRNEEDELSGKSFSAPRRNVLPKPWRKPHPPIWQACGNPPTFAKAGQKGLGAIGFNFSAAPQMAPMIEAYKKAVADAEPIGAVEERDA